MLGGRAARDRRAALADLRSHPRRVQPGRPTPDRLPAYRDGVGDGELAIYTAEGRPLWHLTSYQANPWFINDVVWEDDAHLLATVFQDGTWHLVRFGVDGSAELASPAIGGSDDMAPPVQFAAR